MTRKSYCKINLGLSIINKREDGFNNLETIFIPYKGIHDTITIEKNEAVSLEVENADFTIDVESNLCVRAYRMLEQDFSISPVSIHLIKQIPSGAGLGGGSANAATTLLMLNEMFELELSQLQLAEYAIQLGSDVPFFLHNDPMYATGRGEVLSPIALDFSNIRIEISTPKVHIPTHEAFRNIVPRDSWAEQLQIHTSLTDAVTLHKNKWKDLIVNDFEKYAFEKHPELASIKEGFYKRGAFYAAMSGSGAALFGLFENDVMD